MIQPVLVLQVTVLILLSSVGGLQSSRRRQGHGVYGPRSSAVGDLHKRLRRPFFEQVPLDPETGMGGRNITAVEGGRAILTCVVRHLGANSTVSWIRRGRHPVVLSSGSSKFTSDRRVSVENGPEDPDTWKLVLDPVMERDDALYECQVNTRDKMSLVFKLNVQPAKASLQGESSVYVKAGSTISLTCQINLYSVPPPDIVWYHGRMVLNFDSPRGGISLETEKTRTGTTSKLLVTRATVRDNGNYTCMPSRGDAVSADVHVITDEQQFELRDGQNGSSHTKVRVATLSMFLLLTLNGYNFVRL